MIKDLASPCWLRNVMSLNNAMTAIEGSRDRETAECTTFLWSGETGARNQTIEKVWAIKEMAGESKKRT
ncbi:hypothetical protein Tco_1089985 [Tanacetum coccineum]|uniref:Uncharacterized protein n=1 Tax=Tanacetum coccineum TaxID=301880 RepID=A0ABQ5I4J2_9ASTR